MADTFTVVTQSPGTEYVGGTQTRDVVTVGITTKPHGVYVEFRIPKNVYSAAQVHDYALGYSGTIEALFGITGVVGVAWSQQPTAAGQLQDIITVTVQSSSGDSTDQFTLPLSDITTAAVSKKAAASIKVLDAAEAL